MLIRIRSKDGNQRVELQPTDDIQVLVQKILESAPDADPATLALSSQPRGGETLVAGMKGTVSSLGLKHGDLLFASYSETGSAAGPSGQTISNPASPDLNGTAATAPTATAASSSKQQQAWQGVVEDPVDVALEKEPGKIPRPRDTKFCRHGDRSMCDYCMPLEPYDSTYHNEHNIKHLSFQAYLRKVNAATNKPESATSYIPPLEEFDYRVAIPCPSGSHAPFPGGICSKCQPSAITLQLQQYRMVDHVEFASPSLIENLLSFWRKTACQRFGYLLGRYERYDQVPLGVKAVVEAIHEPPQQGEVDGVQVGLPWEDEGKMEALAAMCGLKVVGMIYTDLVADDSSDEAKKAGKVLCKRHADSFFLSSLETIFAASEQRRHPNPTRFSASGRFSSKYVTCVLTGNAEGGIDVSAYQVSDQAMAMVHADMIEASVDPGTVRLKEDNREVSGREGARYIPDVFYRYKNKYNIDVKENAKPCFPVDYLLVSLTHGFPASPSGIFRSPVPFPSANRPGLSDQSLEKVISKLSPLIAKLPEPDYWAAKGKGKEVEEEVGMEVQTVLSDWDLLAFLDTVGIFDTSDMRKVAAVAVARDPETAKAAVSALLETNAWKTLATIVRESAPQPAPSVPPRNYDGASGPTDAQGFPDIPPEAFDDVQMNDVSGDFGGAGGGGGGGGGGAVVCPHCTFENEPGRTGDCEVCGLPLAS